MVVQDVQNILESWLPEDIAWDRDAIGLQIGSPGAKVRSILVTLDVTDSAIQEAVQKRIDLIITHHPLIFHPLRTVTDGTRVGRLVLQLARANISLYAAHTNLDFALNGVSFALAERLKLGNLGFLQPGKPLEKKVVVFVPADHADALMSAMAEAGAGHIGNYEECSFRSDGTGTFRSGRGARPFLGKPGRREKVPEVRLEMITPARKLRDVISALRSAHPYEEAAYDVYDLKNESSSHGAGVIGELRRAMTLKEFLSHVRRSLGTPTLRYSGGRGRRIKRVAVCGGSGSDLLPAARQKFADAFVTADITYHTFQETDGDLAIIDAGHFETERPILSPLVEYLRKQFAQRKEKVRVSVPSRMSNPVQYN